MKTLAKDLPASLVVFLVALPLCLGIAAASGAPPAAGIVAGAVGGIVVGLISGSPLSVSGPAAGLTTIVAAGVTEVGSWRAFVVAVALAGVLQIGLGILRLGVLGEYVPSAVVKGMLAAIGIILVLKQVPHLVGYDADFEGDEAFLEPNHENTFTALAHALRVITPGAVAIGLAGLAVMALWESPLIAKRKLATFVPGPLVAVALGVGLHELFRAALPAWVLEPEHLVSLPTQGPLALVALPDWSALRNPNVWQAAGTLAVVASLETLLGIAAVDKLDPLNRVSPQSRELFAQGCGNVISGLLGGLPVTSVIVRSSANVTAGAQTKISAISHGVLLLAAAALATMINRIPLAALASILVFTGYKLAKVKLFKEMYARGPAQFLPFLVTILAILATDLLVGIAVGLVAGLYALLRSNFRSAVMVVTDGNNHLVRLRRDVSFLNKPLLRRRLEELPNGSHVLIDLTRAGFIDNDVLDVINEFQHHAHLKDIHVEVKMDHRYPPHLSVRLQVPVETEEPSREAAA